MTDEERGNIERASQEYAAAMDELRDAMEDFRNNIKGFINNYVALIMWSEFEYFKHPSSYRVNSVN